MKVRLSRVCLPRGKESFDYYGMTNNWSSNGRSVCYAVQICVSCVTKQLMSLPCCLSDPQARALTGSSLVQARTGGIHYHDRHGIRANTCSFFLNIRGGGAISGVPRLFVDCHANVGIQYLAASQVAVRTRPAANLATGRPRARPWPYFTYLRQGDVAACGQDHAVRPEQRRRGCGDGMGAGGHAMWQPPTVVRLYHHGVQEE